MADRSEEPVQDYLHRTGVIRIFQTLTTGLLEDQPDEPVSFIISQLRQMSTSNVTSTQPVHWHLFTQETADKHLSAAIPDASSGKKDEETSVNYREILAGSTTNLPPLPSNIVRIFLSSTFSDFKAERTVLPRHAYPKLQQFCSLRGLDFQVVDMRWGVTDEMVNDHMTSSICLREISLCQKISQGPYFVAMLGHRYGFQPLPSTIDAEEFCHLEKICQEKDLPGTELLTEWYVRDDNAVPPVYCLQPISDKLPHYTDHWRPDLRNQAKDTWDKVYHQLQDTLRLSSEAAFDKGFISEDRRRAYFMSVTEEEVRQGIITQSSLEEYALCYVRELEGLQNVPFTNDIVARYLDIKGDNVLDQVAQELLSELVTKTIPHKLKSDHYKAYRTKWTGAPLENMEGADHNLYLEQFCNDFVKDVQNMILKKLKDENSNVPKEAMDIYLEALLHVKFGMKKCEVFCGQEDILEKMKIYMEKIRQPHHPLIVHGRSGFGKTSLLAYFAKHSKSILPSIQCVVMRFLGTTPESSSIRSTLISVTKQLGFLYDLDTRHMDQLEFMSDIRKHFIQTLKSVSTSLGNNKQVLIILDSIDQLSPSFGAHRMHWLPKVLPKNIGLIVSMLNDRYDCYSATVGRLQDPNSFIQLTELSRSTGSNIITQHMKHHSRNLTQDQYSMIMKAFEKCPMPLFLKLLLDMSCEWKSYTSTTEITLPETIHSAINQLFERVEEKFGKVFVSAALGYLTCGKDGLTSIEMEDVLSCDDEVLNAVYVFHDPPLTDVIRVPPLLWARLQHEISEYLVERSADGKNVFSWHHRLFWETAAQRYVEPCHRRKYLHANLAELFISEGTIQKTIVLEKRQNMTLTQADRRISPQPFSVNNKRKLNALPYHLYHSGTYDKVKSRCILNFDWVLTKLMAVSVGNFVEELDRFCEHEAFSNDLTISLMKHFFHLSFEPLKADPQQLAYQAIERLANLCPKYPALQTFLDRAQFWISSTNIPLLIPVHHTQLKSPESALIYSVLAGNSGSVHKDGEIAVCGFLDKVSRKCNVHIFNLKSRDFVETIPSKLSHSFVLSGDARVLAVVNERSVSVFETYSGDQTKILPYRKETFQKCYIKSVGLDKQGDILLIAAKIGIRAHGTGLKYNSDIYQLSLNQGIVLHSFNYSQNGLRCLEHLFISPDEKQFVVTDFQKIVLYDMLSCAPLWTFSEYPVVKANTFCFPESSYSLCGAVGGYHGRNSQLIFLDLKTKSVEVSEILFEPTEEDITGQGTLAKTTQNNLGDSDDDNGPDNYRISRVFELCVDKEGNTMLAGLSSIGPARQLCVVKWDRVRNNVKRVLLPVRRERFTKCMVVFPDWTLCCLGWNDGLMMFVDVVKMEIVWEIKGHEMSINSLTIVPALHHIISIGSDRNLKVWDMDLFRSEIQKAGSTRNVEQEEMLCLNDKQQVVDYISSDSVVFTTLPYPSSPPTAWYLQTALPHLNMTSLLQKHYAIIYPEHLDFRKDSNLTLVKKDRYLVDVRRRRGDGKATVFDLQDEGKVVAHFQIHNPFLIVREDLFVSCSLHELEVRRLPSGKVCWKVKMSPWPKELQKDHINNPPLFLLTFDQMFMIFVNLTGPEIYLETVNVVRLQVSCRSELQESSKTCLSNGLSYLVHRSSATVEILSPASLQTTDKSDITYTGVILNKMVSSSGAHGVTVDSKTNGFTVWKTDSPSIVFKTKHLPQKVHCVAFSPSDSYILTGSYTVISVWSMTNGTRLHSIHTTGAVCRLSFTPSGKQVLCQCYSAPKTKRLIIFEAIRLC